MHTTFNPANLGDSGYHKKRHRGKVKSLKLPDLYHMIYSRSIQSTISLLDKSIGKQHNVRRKISRRYLLFLLSDELRLDFRNSNWHLTLGVILDPLLRQVDVLEHSALLQHFHLPAILKINSF